MGNNNVDDFRKETKRIALVEFFATWCPHCRAMAPVMEELCEKLKGRVPVYQFDYDKESALAEENDVQTLPTLIIFRDGKEVWRKFGDFTAPAVLKEVDSLTGA